MPSNRKWQTLADPYPSAHPMAGIDQEQQHNLLVTGGLRDLNSLPEPVFSGGVTRVVLPQEVTNPAAVQCFQLHFTNVREEEIRRRLNKLTIAAFFNMPKLRLLDIDGNVDEGTIIWKYSHDYEDVHFDNLVWLRWQSFYMKFIPNNIHMENLVILSMQRSQLREVWRGTKSLPNLEVLDLSASPHLTCTPDFSEVPNLKILNLRYCRMLDTIHKSIDQLSKLVELDLMECESLKNLPSGISNLVSLEKLNIDHCYKLEKLPEGIGNLTRVTSLKVNMIGIKEVPSTLGECCSLKSLILSTLPSSIYQLSKLETLDLRGCQSLHSLPMLPSSLCSIDVSYCRSLKKLPNLSNLKHLKRLDLRNCLELKEIEGLEGLESIEFINFLGCNKGELRILRTINSDAKYGLCPCSAYSCINHEPAIGISRSTVAAYTSTKNSLLVPAGFSSIAKTVQIFGSQRLLEIFQGIVVAEVAILEVVVGVCEVLLMGGGMAIYVGRGRGRTVLSRPN
ncbi:hypothetical protein NE237_021588 [Protea cynaroides]|uniref:Uncharacterized protein n=1 Tax=Protea cynaroides TaxID=273540 RepID=A0A9Q0H8T9_9MAGN|nr:hypothetical protein NE237_021588 [Protea cynaroides]